jgi:Family of unknown function (DUF6807)
MTNGKPVIRASTFVIPGATMSYSFPRCEIVPLAGEQVAFRIDGVEKTRWNFGPATLRPFFFPVLGPSGGMLTRIGHPGAPNHDHHLSVWFAHNKVLGIDFWSNRGPALDGCAGPHASRGPARIRQKQWLAYRDGNDEAVMAAALGWYDGHDPKELLEQELVAAVRPLDRGEWELELQATFRPKAESLEFQKTNFGFLAVRVAKDISEHFGGGKLTSSRGAIGEKAIFGKPALWMDYSGPVRPEPRVSVPRLLPKAGVLPAGKSVEPAVEGITYFDHPANPGHPLSWHVREDGWMGASVCMHGPVATTRKSPLVLRHLLHLHRGPVDADKAAARFAAFSRRPTFVVSKSRAKHRQYEVRRKP